MNNKSGFVHFLLLLLSFVLIVAVAGFFIFRYAKTQSDQQMNNSAEVSWKTYTNAELGFQFMYPGNLAVHEQGNGVITFGETPAFSVDTSSFVTEDIDTSNLVNVETQNYTYGKQVSGVILDGAKRSESLSIAVFKQGNTLVKFELDDLAMDADSFAKILDSFTFMK